MVVCPTCREVNEEGRAICQKCGSSLAPDAVALLPRREPGERPPIEMRKPPQPSKWRPLILLGVFLVGLTAVAAFFALRPDPCGDTNFESENFGYCLMVPEGWEAGPAQFGADVTLDQFAPPTGSATVVVEAVDLETGVALEQWSEFVRTRDEGAGLTPGPATPTGPSPRTRPAASPCRRRPTASRPAGCARARAPRGGTRASRTASSRVR